LFKKEANIFRQNNINQTSNNACVHFQHDMETTKLLESTSKTGGPIQSKQTT